MALTEELAESGNKFPPKSCCAHILEDLPAVLEGVVRLEDIVNECEKIALSCLENLPSGMCRLDKDEAVAIVSYTFDLGKRGSKNDEEDRSNLFYVLNLVLRERHEAKMRALRPYLTYLIRGLSKLSAVELLVFRGVPASNLDVVRECQKYRNGVKVHWSAFTSTSSDIVRAKHFAQGPGGIIFRINAVDGRRVAPYSALPMEDEVGKGNFNRLILLIHTC